jgi:hypothetical protein
MTGSLPINREREFEGMSRGGAIPEIVFINYLCFL